MLFFLQLAITDRFFVAVDLMSGMTIGSVSHDSKIGWLEVHYSCLAQCSYYRCVHTCELIHYFIYYSVIVLVQAVILCRILCGCYTKCCILPN